MPGHLLVTLRFPDEISNSNEDGGLVQEAIDAIYGTLAPAVNSPGLCVRLYLIRFCSAACLRFFEVNLAATMDLSINCSLYLTLPTLGGWVREVCQARSSGRIGSVLYCKYQGVMDVVALGDTR